MSFNPLSLSHPDEVSPARRVRAPRRCSCCRQTGHDARRCPDASAVQYRGNTFNMYDNPRDNLIQFVISHFMQTVPQLSGFPELTQYLYQDMFFHISMMTWNEVKTALRNPGYLIDYGRERLQFRIENYRIVQASNPRSPPGPPPRFVQGISPRSPPPNFTQAPIPRYPSPGPLPRFVQGLSPRSPPPGYTGPTGPTLRATGKDYAKNIEIELQASLQEFPECFICCDQLCSVKTSCGHEYCVKCVAKIIYVNKDKTTAPVCSFCKAPFSKFTVSTEIAETKLDSFIKKLA